MLKLRDIPDLRPRKEVGLITEALARIKGGRPRVELRHAPGPDGRPVVVGVSTTTPDLTLDLEVETKTGLTTVGALYSAGAGHTRCQSPFRESSSWAAFYGIHADGSPFIFDTGTDEKHILAAGGRVPMWRIILEWLIEDLRPRYACPDGALFSEARGAKLPMRAVRANHQVIDRLAVASDAPWGKVGVKRLALPTEFRKWLEVAWDALVRSLPTEDEAPAASAEDGEFVRQLSALLTSMVTLAVPGAPLNRGTKSFGSWAYIAAHQAPGCWRRFQTYDLWGRLLDDAGFQLALKPTLATQAPRSYPELASLTLNQMTRRCRQHGIAGEGDNRIHSGIDRLRVAILSADFVASLDLSYDLEDPLAAALRDALNNESGGTAGQSGKPPKGRSIQ